MRNPFKNLFGKTTTTESKAFVEELKPELPMVPENLFIETQHPQTKPAEKPSTDPLKAALERNHHHAGYTDGYDFHDVAMKQNYQDCLIEEVRDIFKTEIWRMDADLVRLNSLLKSKSELDATVIQLIQEQLDGVELKRKQLLDEFEAAEFSRGKVRKALLEYERGFTEGVRDYVESSKFISVISGI